MLKNVGRFIVLAIFILFVFSACSKPNVPEEVVIDSGIHEQLQKSCVSCHAIDASGKMERIDYVRKTPEGWSQTIARMQRLHGVQLTEEEREKIIIHLSEKNGLAPEETEPIQYWLANRQSLIEADPENSSVANSCITCHAGGRFLAQRRTEEEWKNLKDFHLVMFPSIHLNHRHVSPDWSTEADLALDYLAKHLRFDSEEWNNWKGKKYDVAGEWKIIGFQPTKGYYIGDSQFSHENGNYKETKTIRYLNNDKTVSKTADVKNYNGYMLRSQYSSGDKKLRGVYNVGDDGNVIRGDWQRVDDIGIAAQETYYRVQTDKPEIIHLDIHSFKTGTTIETKMYGMNLTKLKKEDIQLPSHVKVIEYTVQSDEQALLKVEVEQQAEMGVYDVALSNGAFHQKLTLYNSIDYVAIDPVYGVSRVGGAGPMDKVSTQFGAYAYSNGKDQKQGTEDDLLLMSVDAEWSLIPYPDPNKTEVLNYLGKIDSSGLFTPREEGINPEREFVNENVSAATVIAKVKIDGKVFEAETHHIQTVPDYVPNIH